MNVINKMDLQEFYKKLDALFQGKNITKTTEFLINSLKEAEESKDLAAIVVTCNELGGICRATGQTDRAKSLYTKVLETLGHMNMLNTEQHATTLINMGDVYISAREWTPALDFFSRAKEMLIKLGLHKDYRMAALCNNISSIYRELEDFDAGEQVLNTAFDIIKEIPECRGELATTYVNLGELQIKQNKLKEAEESFLSSAKIFEDDSGDRDVHYSAALAGLGEVYYLTEDFEQAENYFSKALKLIERDFGKTSSYEIVERNLDSVRKERVNNGANCK